MARHAQITQSNKFAISLQYLMKKVSDEVDFLHADKHKSLLRIDTMISMEMVKHSQGSQNSKFAMSLQYLKKKLEMMLIFRMQVNIKVSYKFISILLELQSVLQGGTIIIDGHDQAFSKFSK